MHRNSILRLELRQLFVHLVGKSDHKAEACRREFRDRVLRHEQEKLRRDGVVRGIHIQLQAGGLGVDAVDLLQALVPELLIAYAERLIDEFDVRSGQGPVTMARAMSGGNQQKAIIAREIDKDPDLLVAVPDRILVMYEGEIVGEFDPKKTTQEELGLYMAGAKRMEVKA